MICCLNPNCRNPENPDGNNYCQSCSVPLTPLLRGRYWIAKLLSDEGGFGRTYLAEDVDKLNEHCVVKQLAPKNHGTWALKKATELFQEEAKRLQLQLGIILLLVTGAGLFGYWVTQWRSQSTTNFGTLPTQVQPTNPSVTTPSAKQLLLFDLDVGSEITSDREITLSKKSKNKSAPNLAVTAPAGSVLQVTKKPISQKEDSIVHLQVCSVGNKGQLNNNTAQTVKKLSNTKSSTTASKPLVKNGEEVWIQFSQLQRLNPLIYPAGKSGQCQADTKAVPDSVNPPAALPKPAPGRDNNDG